jgi:ubiquinone biosynthesis protein UbiJ
VNISSTLAAALESALNLYVGQDPQALRHCAELEGKSIEIDIEGVGISLFLFPGSDGVRVLSHYEGSVDTRLTGSPIGLARLALGSRENTLFEGAVEIRGDTETGQAFQDILARTDWDWEEQLSRVTGDVVAHQAGRLVRGAKRLVDDSRATLEKDVSEYLQEEARMLPTRYELDCFLEDVDQLRSDVDRLNARVARLQHLLDSPS